ncbi:hypothetical protein BEWA_010570 [Theileria equi strain WA]|uniref:t-SNARE coiled-coil homology domain-containing protein n=1 Tax=Theileria equi strain WA TaxID=1537102 RepID=L0B3D9_THEEQ|nr:hypothetical protein BEWA_010570 [Theileria equi strain WA]AFZ81639.1 hypothetical protein BEWA_010570 [Theileria equi strain WA]|eukprot:XP_004831305.1 hypothetical protein BEWA_010570 [Theileria equi strain WA]
MTTNNIVRITIPIENQATIASSEQNFESADFYAQKVLVLNLITSITSDIRERDKLKRDKKSHPMAHIKLSSKLESQICLAYDQLDILKNILTKIQGSKRYRKKYSDSEINGFNDTIKNLEDQVSTCESSVRYKSVASTKRNKVELDLVGPTVNRESLTAEEQSYAVESIKKWRERDEGFDRQLHEIGEAVDRIGEVASQIGEKAMEQAKSAIDTVSKVQDTTNDISAVSIRIRKVLKRQRLMECYFRLILVVTLLTLLAIFLFILMKMIKSKK